MQSEIAGGEVRLGPTEDSVEAGTVVGDQREEHPVGLAFAGGVVLRGVIDHPAMRIDDVPGVALPERPRLLRAARLPDAKHSHAQCKENP